MKHVRVCPRPGCPELQPCPVAGHTRPKNASWSPNRDRKAHWRLRMAVIKARGTQCQRCGWQSPTPQGQGLHLHHVRPSDTPDAVTLLCADCHKAVDTHAR